MTAPSLDLKNAEMMLMAITIMGRGMIQTQKGKRMNIKNSMNIIHEEKNRIKV